MNGPIRKKLGVIPPQVHWASESAEVFEYQRGDFMRPVIDAVDSLLNNTTLQVVIYNGQLDLICDTAGVDRWLSKLKWDQMEKFRMTERTSFSIDQDPQQTAGYWKRFQNFWFFWLLRAGHMAPHDAPYATLYMIDKILAV